MMIAIWSTWGVHTPSLTASTHHPPFTPFHINTKWVSCWWLNIKWVPSSRAAVQCWVGNVDKTNVRRRIMSYLSSRCENVVKSRWRLANFTQLSHLIHFKLHLNQFEISFDTLKWHSKSGFVVFKLDWSRERVSSMRWWKSQQITKFPRRCWRNENPTLQITQKFSMSLVSQLRNCMQPQSQSQRWKRWKMKKFFLDAIQWAKNNIKYLSFEKRSRRQCR